MNTYHKINTIFKRNQETNGLMIGRWSQLEFWYLKDNEWIFTEKVDGTNIRVMFDGNKIFLGGKTNLAILPLDLIDRLLELFKCIPLLKEIFPVKEGEEKIDVCFYGEGYGAGIQKGGKYKSTKDFILFDIKVGDIWLDRSSVEEIAMKLGIEVVPIIGTGTLFDALKITHKGFKSKWGDFIAEGLVLRPKIELKTKRGHRVITKIKCSDFYNTHLPGVAVSFDDFLLTSHLYQYRG